jgi:hypothetical protein
VDIPVEPGADGGEDPLPRMAVAIVSEDGLLAVAAGRNVIQRTCEFESKRPGHDGLPDEWWLD